MLKKFKKLNLTLLLILLVLGPGDCFAWYSFSIFSGGDDWDYHGSGRDRPYSAIIDEYYNPKDVRFSVLAPDNIDAALHNIPTQPTSATGIQPGDVIVNIPNRHGGFNAVVIKRSGDGYVGPNGEYYLEFPKTFQLEMKYGN